MIIIMLFKEKYKRDMENVTPSEEALRKTREKMLNTDVKKPRLFGTKQLAALTACFCLIIASFGAVLLNSAPWNDNAKYNGYENPHVLVPNSDKTVESGAATKLNSETNYDDIFDKIDKVKETRGYYETVPLTDGDSEMMDEATKSTDSMEKNDVTDHSDTNNQVSGVHEADIIKTDGKYIYACGKTNEYYRYYRAYDSNSSNDSDNNTGRVYILSADNGQIELVSTIKILSNVNDIHYVLTEILLYNDTLVLIKSGYKNIEQDISNESNPKIDYYYNPKTYFTSVEVYDISDRANPKFQNELYQSGIYNSSRMIDSSLYIVTSHYVYNADKDKPETYIPYCSSYRDDYLVPSSCIYAADEITNRTYTVITGIDVTKPDNHISNAAVLGFAGTVYSSKDNIYIASYRANNINNYSGIDIAFAEGTPDAPVTNSTSADNQSTPDTSKAIINGVTDIYRFSIDKAEVIYSASGSVGGNLLNQFSMDEYNGAFRIATTVDEYVMTPQTTNNGEIYYHSSRAKNYNNLYILDQNMKITGSITKMAPTERIYSVRFDGDIGYVVTFRQIDPLFAIDLSDTSSPKVLSALKIPGFSTYMQPYGDGLLFGFGKDAGSTNGLKLSMFDVSDKTDVTEQAILKLGSEYYNSAAMNNHKAILVDAKKNLIGFPVEQYSNNNYNCGYVFYKYDNGKFELLGNISNDENNYNYQGLRGLYIGNYVYIFSENQFITSYDLSSFSKVDSISFQNN